MRWSAFECEVSVCLYGAPTTFGNGLLLSFNQVEKFYENSNWKES